MVDKKKFHGGLKVLLSLLFIMLLGTCSTCYANVSEDYIKYTIENLKENGDMYSNLTTLLNNINETSITQGVSRMNQLLSNNNLSNLDDKNLILLPSYSSSQLYFIFSNCSYPNGYDNLAFLKLYGAGINNTSNGYWVTFGAQGTGNIYYIRCGINAYSYNLEVQALITLSGSQTENANLGLNGTNAFSDNSEIFYFKNVSVYNLTQSVYTSYPITSSSNISSRFVRNYIAYNNTNNNGVYVQPEPEPEQPSGDTGTGTGTITNPSGEVTGQIDLSGIENGIKDIKDTISGEAQAIRDTISGETGKVINILTDVPDLSNTEISSGDITSALGFEFMADPYDNFWLQMITGLSGALTNSVRKIPINWLGYNGYFDLDELDFNYPEPIRTVLTAVSTVSMVWLLVKWWKIIIDKLSSGDIDEVLAMNEEERYY